MQGFGTSNNLNVLEAWITREMSLSSDDAEQKVVVNLIELCFYLLFIILINISKFISYITLPYY